MRDSTVHAHGAASHFFDNYLKCLVHSSVPEKQRRWYVKRVEDFIRAQNVRKIKVLAADEPNRFFAVIGREGRLPSWQFLQCIAAIRILANRLQRRHPRSALHIAIAGTPLSLRRRDNKNSHPRPPSAATGVLPLSSVLWRSLDNYGHDPYTARRREPPRRRTRSTSRQAHADTIATSPASCPLIARRGWRGSSWTSTGSRSLAWSNVVAGAVAMQSPA